MTSKIDSENRKCAIFIGSSLCLFTRYQNFLWLCWFLCLNVTNFGCPRLKLNNPIDHTLQPPFCFHFENFKTWEMILSFENLGSKNFYGRNENAATESKSVQPSSQMLNFEIFPIVSFFLLNFANFSQLIWIEKCKISNSCPFLSKCRELLILDFSIHVNFENWHFLRKKDTIGKISKFSISLDG